MLSSSFGQDFKSWRDPVLQQPPLVTAPLIPGIQQNNLQADNELKGLQIQKI